MIRFPGDGLEFGLIQAAVHAQQLRRVAGLHRDRRGLGHSHHGVRQVILSLGIGVGERPEGGFEVRPGQGIGPAIHQADGPLCLVGVLVFHHVCQGAILVGQYASVAAGLLQIHGQQGRWTGGQLLERGSLYQGDVTAEDQQAIRLKAVQFCLGGPHRVPRPQGLTLVNGAHRAGEEPLGPPLLDLRFHLGLPVV